MILKATIHAAFRASINFESLPRSTEVYPHQAIFVGTFVGISWFDRNLYQQIRIEYELTNTRVKNAKPKVKAYKLTDGEGMYLLVHPNGSKYWRLNYRFQAKQKTLALGVYPLISLAEAREARNEAKTHIAKGIDPNELKKRLP